jgi:hypothetical protein
MFKRYATFSNGFQYKFWLGYQHTGFDFLEGNGVECDDIPEMAIVSFLYNVEVEQERKGEQKWKEDNETKYQMMLWAKEQDD